MNRNLQKISYLLPALLAHCATTAPKTATRVDTEKKELYITSSNDKRSEFSSDKNKKTLAKAEKSLNSELKENPKDVKSMISLAQVALSKGNLTQAGDLARNVLRMEMKNQEARKVLSEIAVDKAEFDLAEIYLIPLGGNLSKDAQVLNLSALIALGRNQNALAAKLFKQALTINPNDVATRLNLGALYIKYRQMAAAGIEFERVLKVDPANLDAKLHLGIVKAARGDLTGADSLLKDVVAHDKMNYLALFNLAVIEKRKNHLDESEKFLKESIRYASRQSGSTDQAFAMLEDIQQERAAHGQKVSDQEIRQLADQAESKKSTVAKSDAVGKPTKAAQAKDAEQDDLEKFIEQ